MHPWDNHETTNVATETGQRDDGVYTLSGEEKAAIDAARRSGFASDDEVAAFWKRIK